MRVCIRWLDRDVLFNFVIFRDLDKLVFSVWLLDLLFYGLLIVVGCFIENVSVSIECKWEKEGGDYFVCMDLRK